MPASKAAPRWATNLLVLAAVAYTACVYGTMAMMSVAAGLVLAAWLLANASVGAARWREDFGRIRSSPIFAPTLWLAVACLWSLAWALLTGLEFYGMKPTITWDDTRKAWHLAFNLVLFAVFSRLSDRAFRGVAKTWIALGVASSVLGVVQHYVPLYEPMQLPHTMRSDWAPPAGLLGWFAGKYHATGLAGFHLSFSAIIGFPTAVMMALTAVLWRREGFSRRTALALSGLLACFAANMLTYSKTAWAAAPLTAMLIVLIGMKGRARYAVVLFVALVGLSWGFSSVVRERFSDNRARSLIEREMVWDANLEMIKAHPLFGVGWHRNSELSVAYFRTRKDILVPFESHAHNNLLDQWATTGLFGLATFVWLNVVLVVLARRTYLGRHELLWRVMGLGLVGGWFCLHVNGLTQANWWDAKVLHQLSWVTALTAELHRRSARPRA